MLTMAPELALATLGAGLRLILPVALTLIPAVLLPILLSRVVGKGIWGMLANLVLSCALMLVIAPLLFVVPYLIFDHGALGKIMEQFTTAAIFFGKLGAMASMLWGPVLILTVTSHLGWRGRGTETAY